MLTYLAEVGVGIALGTMLEGTGMIDAGDENEGPVAVSPEVAYFRKSEINRWQDLLREALERLPPAESRVLRYHYQQEIPFDDISAMLEVSRSRVSKLHRQGLARLRSMLGQAPPDGIAL